MMRFLAPVLGVLVLAVAAGDARAGGDVVMQPGDRLTVDGRQYTCERAYRGHRADVVLSPGDVLTVGDRRLMCAPSPAESPPETPPPPPPGPAPIEVHSSIDNDCVSAAFRAITGNVPEARAAQLADVCRTFHVNDQRCRVTRNDEDHACFESLDRAITGNFVPDVATTVMRSCRTTTASCQLDGDPLHTTVDLGCVDQLFRATAGNPNARTAIGWVDSCRTGARRGCVAIAGAFDADCFSRVNRMVSGNLDIDGALGLVRACHSAELRCAP